MTRRTKSELYWTAKLAIITFIAFLIGLVINFYRLELFGVVPGNAGNNFSFNIGFFIPYNLIVLLSYFVIIITTILKWRMLKTRDRFISLGFTVPIVILWAMQIIRILSL